MKRLTFILIMMAALLIAGCNNSNQKRGASGEIDEEFTVTITPIKSEPEAGPKYPILFDEDGVVLKVIECRAYWKGSGKIGDKEMPVLDLKIKNISNKDFTELERVECVFINTTGEVVKGFSPYIDKPLPAGCITINTSELWDYPFGKESFKGVKCRIYIKDEFWKELPVEVVDPTLR